MLIDGADRRDDHRAARSRPVDYNKAIIPFALGGGPFAVLRATASRSARRPRRSSASPIFASDRQPGAATTCRFRSSAPRSDGELRRRRKSGGSPTRAFRSPSRRSRTSCTSSTTGSADIPWIVSFFLAAWFVGFFLSSRSRQTERARERAERLELEREVKARAAVAEERARIARELHDIVGHSVSVMTVQASAVRRLLREDQEREREALHHGRGDRARRARGDAPARRRPAAARGGAGAGPAAEPRVRREARRADARGRAADRAAARGRRLTSCRQGIDLTAYRLRAGGPDERAQARERATTPRCVVRYADGSVELVVRDDGNGNGNGRRQRARARRDARARRGLRRRARRRAAAGAAATSCARGCRSPPNEPPRPDRRRPGARAGRLPHDPRGGAGHRGRRRSGRRARGDRRRRDGSSRTSS